MGLSQFGDGRIVSREWGRRTGKSINRDSRMGYQVDLFATRLTAQIPRFFSWRPDPETEAVDAFVQEGNQARLLQCVQLQRAMLVLFTPVWLTQPSRGLLPGVHS